VLDAGASANAQLLANFFAENARPAEADAADDLQDDLFAVSAVEN
jgi:hypothetical protein